MLARQVTVSGDATTEGRAWLGRDVAADAGVRVGTVQAVVPEAEDPLCLDLELHLPAGAVVVHADDESRIEL